MRQGLDLPNLVSELEYLHENRRDFLVNTESIKILPPNYQWDDSLGKLKPVTPIMFKFTRPDRQSHTFPMTQHMLTQIANHITVPMRLIDNILTKGTQREAQSLCHFMTARLQSHEAIRMVRTQSRFYEEPVARAFVSDRYREIDHWPLAQAIIPILNIHPHLKLISAGVTDTHMYLKIVSTMPEMSQNIGTVFNTQGKEVGDILQFGVMITNSEVGASSVRVTPFMFRLACTNGAVMADELNSIKKTHIGRQIKGSSGQEITDRGPVSSTTTFLADVEVMVDTALKDATLAKKIADKFKLSKKSLLTGDPGAVMDHIGKMYGLFQEEVKMMTKYLVQNLDMNKFGVINAITQYAARNKSASYDRITEIEAVGGRVLDMSLNVWAKVSKLEYTPEDIAEMTKKGQLIYIKA